MKKRFGFALLGCVLLMGVFANPGWTQEEKKLG